MRYFSEEYSRECCVLVVGMLHKQCMKTCWAALLARWPSKCVDVDLSIFWTFLRKYGWLVC